MPRSRTGQLRVANRFYRSSQRCALDCDVGNYSAPVAIGAVMRSLAVGEVIASRHPDYAVGEILAGWFGWQERAVVAPDAIVRRVTENDLPLSLALGVLGINGVTAHLALT
jgi:NADPH-dependent curcumin reductase CurA